MYLNSNRWDRTSHYIALRCQVFAKIDYLIEYKNYNYYIYATLVYIDSPSFPISHQYKRVIVIVFWSDYPDEVIHVWQNTKQKIKRLTHSWLF